MAKHTKALLAVAAVGMVMCFVSTVRKSTAQDIGGAAEERFAGATISLEAVVVMADVQVLEEIAGSSDVLVLTSVPADKVLALADGPDAEVILTLIHLPQAVSGRTSGAAWQIARHSSCRTRCTVASRPARWTTKPLMVSVVCTCQMLLLQRTLRTRPG